MVGLLLGAAIALFFNVLITFQLVAVIVLGSILPDIDLHKSKASKVANVVGIVALTPVVQPFFTEQGMFSWVIALLVSIVALFLLFLPLRLKHRGATHSLPAAVVFGILLTIAVGRQIGIIGTISYASHLVVDKA